MKAGVKKLGPKSKRQAIILRELQSQPAVRASTLAAQLGVHVETIRRDLDELVELGKISRTYGGASRPTVGIEEGLDVREQLLVEERSRIARAAAQMIEPGDVVMIDVGSTAAQFVSILAELGTNARLITNSTRLPAIASVSPGLSCILCPGEYSAHQGGVFGLDTTEYIRNLYADKLVFSAGGMTDDGVYEFDQQFAWVKKAMLARSAQAILLLDSSKIGRKVMSRVCGIEDIDVLVTERDPEPKILTRIMQSDIKLVIT